MIWAPSALADADAIAEFIARDSSDRAALFVTRLFEASELLARSREMGRVIPELGDEARREILVGAYRVMYRIEEDQIFIVAIVHGARNWPEPPMDDPGE
ncbi:MAG: type II toxin-antitoxin system RelE/ParE family toxin [Phycisphaerales bacterium]